MRLPEVNTGESASRRPKMLKQIAAAMVYIASLVAATCANADGSCPPHSDARPANVERRQPQKLWNAKKEKEGMPTGARTFSEFLASGSFLSTGHAHVAYEEYLRKFREKNPKK